MLRATDMLHCDGCNLSVLEAIFVPPNAILLYILFYVTLAISGTRFACSVEGNSLLSRPHALRRVSNRLLYFYLP